MSRKKTYTHIGFFTYGGGRGEWVLANDVEGVAWGLMRRCSPKYYLTGGFTYYEFSRPVTRDEVQIFHNGDFGYPEGVETNEEADKSYVRLLSDDEETLTAKRQRLARLVGFRPNIQDRQLDAAYKRLLKKKA